MTNQRVLHKASRPVPQNASCLSSPTTYICAMAVQLNKQQFNSRLKLILDSWTVRGT